MPVRPLVRAALAAALLTPASFAGAQSGPTPPGPPEDPASIERPPVLQGPSVDAELAGPREPEVEPWRVVGWLGVGGAVRLVEHDDFQQDRLAPAYLDLSGALVFPGPLGWRHAVGLGLSLNLTRDGTFSAGVDEGTQLVITPSYVGYVQLDPVPDVVPYVRAGLPLAVTPDLSPGLELGGGASYMLLAGLGAYAEVSLAGFLGAESRAAGITVHPVVAAEVGVTVDWELLEMRP